MQCHNGSIKRTAGKLLLLTSIAVFLMGCSTFSRRRASESTDAAHVKLAEAAASVSHSLQELAEIESAVHPHAYLPPPPNPARIGMQRLASVDWSGPVEPITKEIAKASHYRLRVLGRRPAIPVLVALRTKNTPLADVLRNVKFQAAKKATIKIYPKRRVIELRYLRRS